MKTLQNHISESILGSTSTGARPLIEKWCREHKILGGFYKINSDLTISPTGQADKLNLDYYGYTELPHYIKFSGFEECTISISKPKELYYKYNMKIDSFRGLPTKCRIFSIVTDQKTLPPLKIEVTDKILISSYNLSKYENLDVTFTGNGVGELALKAKADLDNVKVKGAKIIDVVNDFHLGDMFSKAMNRKAPMNKYRNSYTQPALPEVEDIIKNFWKGIDTSSLVTIEYTQNSKLEKYRGVWYRCKNW